jgi:hypothetical protein
MILIYTWPTFFNFPTSLFCFTVHCLTVNAMRLYIFYISMLITQKMAALCTNLYK